MPVVRRMLRAGRTGGVGFGLWPKPHRGHRVVAPPDSALAGQGGRCGPQIPRIDADSFPLRPDRGEELKVRCRA